MHVQPRVSTPWSQLHLHRAEPEVPSSSFLFQGATATLSSSPPSPRSALDGICKKTVMLHLLSISGAHERFNKALRSAIQPSWTRSGSSSSREWPCCSQSVLNLILWLLACCCVLLWPPQVPVRCLVDCGPHS